MENIIKKIKKGAKHTRLYAPEKAEMRSVLVRHMKVYPVRGREGSQRVPTSNGANPVDSATISLRPRRESADSGISSPFFNINNFRNKKGISILAIGGLLMSGTVSLAAENTIPGDVLYPVKVHVNENLRGALAVTPKAKADWDVQKTERRLEEVEKLAVAPNVSPEVKASAEADFTANTERVQEHIAKFEEDNDSEDAIDTAGKFTEMLRKHEGVLGKRNFERTTIATDTASTTEIATTTPVAPVNNAELDDVLQNVRGARGNAEKKQKELKQKYHKETKSVKDNNEVSVSSEVANSQSASIITFVATSTSSQTEVSRNKDSSDFGRRGREHSEEFRTAPTNLQIRVLDED